MSKTSRALREAQEAVDTLRECLQLDTALIAERGVEMEGLIKAHTHDGTLLDNLLTLDPSLDRFRKDGDWDHEGVQRAVDRLKFEQQAVADHELLEKYQGPPKFAAGGYTGPRL